MEGKNDLKAGVRAGYAFFYCRTLEVKSTLEAIREVSSELPDFQVEIFDLEENQDPEGFLYSIEKMKPRTIVVAKNFHWFLKDDYGNINKAMVQYIQNRVEIWISKEYRKTLIILGDISMDKAIPECLRKDFLEINFPLPNKEEIKTVFDSIANSAKASPKYQPPTEEEIELIIQNSKGLSRRELGNAYAFTLIKNEGKFDPKTVAMIQASEVEKTAGLKIGEYKDLPEPLGYDAIKEFVLPTINHPDSKGILLLGPPGTGKTHFAQWVGSKSGLKVIEMEMARMQGEGLYGQAENAWAKAIEVIIANTPCILFIDEIEKGLAGLNSSGQNDGGTGKRSASQFLKLLSNRPEGLYVIATCNDISQLPPEYVRAERWDCAPFFIDLPNKEEATKILDFYKTSYNVDGEPSTLEGWSGAEIKSVCRICSMFKKTKKGIKLQDVERFVIPVSKTLGERIEDLRKWAKDRTIPASTKINGKSEIKQRDIDL